MKTKYIEETFTNEPDYNKIYVYTTKTYREISYFKVGETVRSVEERVYEEQDKTSNPEPLLIEYVAKVPKNITDSIIHSELEKEGCIRTRIDKKREWYDTRGRDTEQTIHLLRTIINRLIYKVNRPFSYSLRPEQQDCVNKASKYFNSGGDEFLAYAKMRFGKIFTTYHIIKEIKAKSVLIVTYKPAVKSGWADDLENHVAFAGWKYHADQGFQYDSTSDVNIIFASFQDLNEIKKSKWRGIKSHHFDLIVIDEQHYGSETERAQITLNSLNFSKKLELSGTPFRALESGKYTDENTYTWTYNDEQAKKREEEEKGSKTDTYKWMPKMGIHTINISDDVKQSALKHYSSEEQFTMDKMFATNNNGVFKDKASVKLFLDNVFGHNVKKDHSPIKRYAPDHILMVLPNSVDSVNAMENFLNKYQSEYVIANVAGDNISDFKKFKTIIKHEKKTITLTAGTSGRFTTGVTVPEWEMIIMLDNGHSPQAYFQSIFRIQSSNKDKEKTDCTVIDYNPERTLDMIFKYCEGTAKKNQSTISAIKEFLDFAPIFHSTENDLQPIKVEDIVNGVNKKSKNCLNIFKSNGVINSGVAKEFESIFKRIEPLKENKSKLTITTNELELGKTFIKQERKTGTKNKKDPNQKTLDKAKKFLSLMPEYVFFLNGFESIDDIIEKSNPKKFKEHFEITLSDFKKMIDGKFFHKERLNRAITSLLSLNHDEDTIFEVFKFSRDYMFLSSEIRDIMIQEVKDRYKKIAIVESYELIPKILELGKKDITLFIEKEPRETIKSFLKMNGVKYKIANLGRKEKMEFDCTLGNPPYNGKKQLHQKFFNKAYELTKYGGKIVFLQPATPYQNQKEPRSHEAKMRENVLNYKTDVKINDASIFKAADIGNDLAVTILHKVKNPSGKLNSITYKDGKKYTNVNLKDISMTGIAPDVFSKIKNKYENYIKKNGSLQNATYYKLNEYIDHIAGLAKIRGHMGQHDLYTFQPSDITKTEYYTTDISEEHDFGIKVKNNKQIKNVYSYLTTYVARFGLAILKNNPNNHMGEFAKVPLVDFNMKWTDEMLIKELGLTQKEMKVIVDTLGQYHD